MNLLAYLACVIVPVISVHGATWDAVTVKYPNYISLPMNCHDAEDQGWSSEGIEQFSSLNIYCNHSNTELCILYDDNKMFAGMQFGLPKKYVQNSEFQFEKYPLYMSKKFLGEEMYTIIVLIKDNGNGKSVCMMKGTGGEFHFPDHMNAMESEPGFTRSFCNKGMGRHYYYGIDSDSWLDFAPPFLLYDGDNGNLVGGGVNTFGGFKDKSGKKEWFEDVPEDKVACMLGPKNETGFSSRIKSGWTSIHFYGLPKEEAAVIPCDKPEPNPIC